MRKVRSSKHRRNRPRRRSGGGCCELHRPPCCLPAFCVPRSCARVRALDQGKLLDGVEAVGPPCLRGSATTVPGDGICEPPPVCGRASVIVPSPLLIGTIGFA